MDNSNQNYVVNHIFINHWFKKVSEWFSPDELDDLDRLILILLIKHSNVHLNIIYTDIVTTVTYSQLTLKELNDRLAKLAQKDIIIFDNNEIYFSSETFFIAIKSIANHSLSSEVSAILKQKDATLYESLMCADFLLSEFKGDLTLPSEFFFGYSLLVGSHGFWKQSFQAEVLDQFARMLPDMIIYGLNINHYNFIYTILSKHVQQTLSMITRPVHYDFFADSWIAATGIDDLILFAKPIDSQYLKTRKGVFSHSTQYFSITSVIDILIRKVIDFNNLNDLKLEFTNMVNQIDYAYNNDFLSFAQTLVFADQSELISMCENIYFVRNCVVDGDLNNEVEYHNLLLFLIAIYPVIDSDEFRLLKLKLLSEPYIEEILNLKPFNAMTDTLNRLAHDIFRENTNHFPFFKPYTLADKFIGELSKILKPEIPNNLSMVQTRLVWVIEEELRFIPKVQKMTKKGWSAGQIKSIDDLEIDSRHYDLSLAQADQKIIDAVKVKHLDRYSSYLKLDLAILTLMTESKNVIDNEGNQITIIEMKKLVVARVQNSTFKFEVYPSEIKSLRTFTDRTIKLFEVANNIFAFENIESKAKLVLEHITNAPLMSENEKDQVIELISPVCNYYDEALEKGTVTVIDWKPSFHIWLKMNADEFSFEITLQDEINDITIPSFNTENWVEIKKDVWCKRNLESELHAVHNILGQIDIPITNELKPYYRFELSEMPSVIDKLAEVKDVTLHWYHLKSKIKILTDEDFKIRIDGKNGWFQVSGDISIDGIEFLQLQKLFEAKRTGFITLENETIQVVLTKALKERVNLLESVLDEDFKVDGKLAYPLQQLLTLMNVESDDAWRSLSNQWQQPVNINPSLLMPLRDYQKESVKWAIQLLSNGFGACLADDMGLGKTIQALKVIEHFANLGASLVIAPKSVLYNWKDEVKKFSPTLNPIIFDEVEDKIQLFNSLTVNDLLIIGYSQVTIWKIELSKIDWQTAVLDEAQNIKNHNTQRSKAIFSLNAKGKLTLSGTPIENHLVELWSQFAFINPGLLGTIQNFKKKYGLAHKDENDLARLRAIASPFIMRRLKKEVLKDLPDKIEINHRISLDESERTLYEVVRQNALNNARHNPIELLSALTRLRQICCDPYLVFNEKTAISSKLQEAMTLITEGLANGHKILIFSQFVGLLTRLGSFLKKESVPYSVLTGQSRLKERADAIEQFKTNQTNVFLISLKAGGTGLNLTEADIVIHLDPWWNPAVEDQASDRAHRIGQTQVVTVYRLVTENTIEEKIIQLHDKKRDLAEKVLSDQDSSEKLSPELLLSLLQDD
ncbi:DEAD/DEAH box helicase [Thorsellia anophelis]|uniref:Superfamily II DNA or RNA helicase, SNF2 family n=1 Tax=Thorsellia anophelis DSM 18579 TaxID=1123402 RepID=A0A1I0D2J8_9GAMM|nr:DEAD/DEAH box helicase [Thorsellia anophelis]SET26129.1 Superfamily II DNA or RNA helicase, SNF2 family [Thorsellia anophelis DSM 18579]